MSAFNYVYLFSDFNFLRHNGLLVGWAVQCVADNTESHLMFSFKTWCWNLRALRQQDPTLDPVLLNLVALYGYEGHGIILVEWKMLCLHSLLHAKKPYMFLVNFSFYLFFFLLKNFIWRPLYCSIYSSIYSSPMFSLTCYLWIIPNFIC